MRAHVAPRSASGAPRDRSRFLDGATLNGEGVGPFDASKSEVAS